jgi:magnesium-transporting ATPase (P-type)
MFQTGTLTQDKMLFRGLVAVPAASDMPVTAADTETQAERAATRRPSAASVDDIPAVDVAVESDMARVPAVPLAVMGACHALFRDPRSGKVIGMQWFPLMLSF